ncbi:MAG: hypothetical protein A2Y25_04135 [Candidatus Melainabacteria bacterium GWF2_37_15]|nr:MAG: hypothetical protein A2Y25_04135 [Candidatus Melainabacteria bacterium GWF2_37_15]
MKTQKIDIILPSRIGDSILSIPAIVCLEQLSKKYGSNLKIRVLSRPFLAELLSSLELFNCKGMTLAQKCRSAIFPADKAFYIETTNNNLGYFSKESYGIINPFKKFLKFTHQPIYLQFSYNPFPETWESIKNSFPEGLVSFLQEKYGLGWYSISLFGICLELGYSAEQIMETFKFSPMIPEQTRDDKVVFCVEAGYGKKHLNERCWDTDGYFKIAEKCFEDFGIKSVFVGVNTETPLPDREYIEDLRGKVSLLELANQMKSAHLYIGNDTGPMHIANLMNTPSVAVYFREEHMAGFSPIFPEINTKVYRPESIEPIYSEVVRILTPEYHLYLDPVI